MTTAATAGAGCLTFPPPPENVLPYVTPQISTWKRRMLREKDLTDAMFDDDALIFEGIGGSGRCGNWFVIDLARREETYRRELCDGRIDPRPPGSPGR